MSRGSEELVTGPRLLTDLHASADPEDAVGRAKYFGAVPGGYAEGDQHLGIRVPVLRGLAWPVWRSTTFADLDLLVTDVHHEARLLACLLAALQFRHANDERAAELVAWTVDAVQEGHLDNWDLVDSVAPYVVGEWVLADLARRPVLDALTTSANQWSRRFAMVATQALVRGGEYTVTLELAAAAVSDPSVWVHKAAGWMLRELGQQDRPTLDDFLERYAATMPRVMLRAALAKHAPETRQRFMDARSQTRGRRGNG